MNKFGLFLDFIGFVLLFWQSAVRPQRKLGNGGGSGIIPADEKFQMEKALKWIRPKSIRKFLAKNWQLFAFGLITVGIFCQIISCT